jgi:ABC-type amino acid transport substrate-binding protein
MKKEIEIISSPWDPEFKDLIKGSLDIVISAVPIEAEKTAIIDYSNPYYTLEYLLVSLSGSEIRAKEDLAGKKIGVLKMGKSNISEDYLTNYEVSDYENIMDMLDALGNKEIEAVLINLPLAVSLLKNNKDMYLVLDKINSDREFALAFKKGSSLVSEVNQILDMMVTDGKYQSIYDKWFNYNF